MLQIRIDPAVCDKCGECESLLFPCSRENYPFLVIDQHFVWQISNEMFYKHKETIGRAIKICPLQCISLQEENDTDFIKAFDKLIGIEGGHANDSDDRGGETKYGISKRSYPDLDIAALTIDDAKKIYKRDFWDFFRLDEFHSQAIAEELFDSHVNIGPKVGEWLQQAYNLTNYWQGDKDIKPDGLVGSKTIAAINNAKHPDRILKVLNGIQIGHYIKIVKDDPRQEKWFGGWLKRVWEEK